MAQPENDMDTTARGRTDHVLQQQWHGWGSPVGLGLGLALMAGFFTLLALGLSVLASIG